MSLVRSIAGVVALCTGLALASAPVHTQIDDLDGLDDARFLRDLEAELDDIYAQFPRDAEVPLEDLKDAILTALEDTGDAGDAAEEEISFDELEAEMEEADTTLEDVIDDALAEADAMASNERQGASIVRVAGGPGAAVQRRGNGRTTPRQANAYAARGLLRVSNAK
jgi:hypothetical protein